MTTNQNGQQQNQHEVIACSREVLDELMSAMQGYEAELIGHQHSGHARAVMGRSFGRPEGEIREDIDRVQAKLRQCNPES